MLIRPRRSEQQSVTPGRIDAIELAGRAELRGRRARRSALVALGGATSQARTTEEPTSPAGGAPGRVVDEYLTVASATSEPVGAGAEQQVLARGGLYQRVLKRLIDVLAAAVFLVLSAPIMLVVALVIRVRMGPGVIYRQQRVGLGGRHFTMYKFRTMRADQRTGTLPFDGPDRRVCHKTDGDPRLTQLGRFLRRWSLDELPQLVNVLRGEMSFVGPRPELTWIVDGYEPWQRVRHLVKPGLTGYWQVYARGGAALMHECTALDIAYVEDMSLLTDLKILLLTFPAIAGMRRGY